MNNNIFYQEYLRQIAEDEAKERQANDPFSSAKNAAAKIGSYGDKFSTVGDAINNYVNNPTAQTIGSKISALGSKISGGANSAINTLNTPQNYFKGFANRTIGNGLQNAGNYLAQKTGLANTIGTGLQSLGSSLTGSGAAATGAASGSAAGGATAAGPIGALIGLGIMGIQGANRNRAKKSGEALLNSTNQMVNEGAENALAETQQNAANLQAQSQQAFNNGIVTGGAATPQQLSPIEEYQDYLRGQGYSDDIVNGVPQGLNGGNKDIADWINQYNTGTGKDNPINIPQTDEEIAAAKAGTFNNLQAGNATTNVKQGLLDKFINGVSDLSKGYQENKENAFKPENLKRDDSKNKMTRLGEVAGTISRAVQKPAVQALLAGGLSTALTGNPLYGLGQAYKFGSNRSMDNVYRNVLNQYGINTPEVGMFGNLNSGDMKNIGNMAETNAWHEYLKQKNSDELAAKIAKNEADKDYKEKRAATMQQNAETNAYKAKNGSKVTHVSNNAKPQSKSVSGKEATVQMQAPNGKIYIVPESQIGRYKKAGGKIVG